MPILSILIKVKENEKIGKMPNQLTEKFENGFNSSRTLRELHISSEDVNFRLMLKKCVEKAKRCAIIAEVFVQGRLRRTRMWRRRKGAKRKRGPLSRERRMTDKRKQQTFSCVRLERYHVC